MPENGEAEKTMKALVFKAPGEMALETVATPQPAAGEILVRVRAAGICGSDLYGFRVGAPGRIPPMIMGHECAGDVASIGPGVSGWALGDRVTVQPLIFCGVCPFCREGRVNLCDRKRMYGVRDVNGAMAEYIAVAAPQLYRLPESMRYEHGAMVEPLAVAYMAARAAGPVEKRRAAIVGAGPIGLLLLQVLRFQGAGAVLVADINSDRLELARRFGAAAVCNSAAEDAVAFIRDRTNGEGADVTFEAVGLSATVQLALATTRKGGRCVWIGNAAPTVEMSMKEVVLRELEIRGTYAYTHQVFGEALDFIARHPVQLDALITRVAPLEEGAAAFRELIENTGDRIKTILTM